MTAAACCTSNSVIYKIQVISTRSQFTPILTRNSLSSPASSRISISEIRRPVKLKNTTVNDINNNNNNNHYHHQVPKTSIQSIPYGIDDNETVADMDEEQFLAMVGLRRKTKTPSKSIPPLRPLAKRLAAPICLLPLQKYGQRVRKALYILLPFLKFLSITHDIELFCSSNDQTKDECLLTRSVTQIRTSKPIHKKTNKRKVSKSEFINMAANTFRNNSIRRTPMGQYISSTLQCNVIVDRLEQSTIDQIMKDSTDSSRTNIDTRSNVKRSLRSSPQQEISSLPKVQNSLNQTTTTTTRTTITTMTTEKTTVKHKLMTTSCNDPKRFKSTPEIGFIDNSITKNNNQLTLSYQRIYLKCFVCSKREYIDAQATNSDILHSHWLEHGNDLSLNIYDSIIDSSLTRVVEFFHFPKRHALEGKIQTVFILNSKEIRKTASKSFDDDTCIILD